MKIKLLIFSLLFNFTISAMTQELYDQLAKKYYDDCNGDHVDKDHITRLKNEIYNIFKKVNQGHIAQDPDSLKAELNENDLAYINSVGDYIVWFFMFRNTPAEIVQFYQNADIDLNKLTVIYHYFNTIVKKYYIECELVNHLKRIYIEFEDIDSLYTFIAEFKNIPGEIILETTKHNTNHYYAIFEINPLFSNDQISDLIKKNITAKYKKIILDGKNLKIK